MKPHFTVSGRVRKPVEEVFEAVVNPDQLSGYFTTGGAKGRLETGVTVYWTFAEFPDSFPVEIVEVVKNEKIVLVWDADERPGLPKDIRTRTTMLFESLDDDRTLVTISEEGWPATEPGYDSSYGNCMGWSQMLCAMKAWLEHGINLREGMYV